MQDFEGRTAVVTGAASGIGRGLARHCAREGMAVVLADVDLAGLEATREELADGGARVLVQPTDVSREEQVTALADAAEAAFGRVHLVFNNAGVLTTGSGWEASHADWEWVLGVNLWGVIHGVRVFVPRLLEHGEPSHLVNTASVGGLLVGPFLTPYVVSKHAVVALSESLHLELAARGGRLRVSALCPGAVATGIGHSDRIRPETLREPRGEASAIEQGFEASLRQAIAAGAPPDSIAAATFDAIREERFWILPDPLFKAGVEARARSILDGTDPRAAQQMPAGESSD